MAAPNYSFSEKVAIQLIAQWYPKQQVKRNKTMSKKISYP